jgi:hypothetical protein
MAKQKSNAANQNLVETGASQVVDSNLLSMAAGKWVVPVEWQGTGKPACSVEEVDGFTLAHVDLPDGPLGQYHISIQQPFIDIYRSWAGAMDCWRGSELTSIALNYNFDTAGNRHLPVICNYSRQGKTAR